MLVGVTKCGRKRKLFSLHGPDFEALQVDSLAPHTSQFLFQAMFGSDQNLPLLSSRSHIDQEKSNEEAGIQTIHIRTFQAFGIFCHRVSQTRSHWGYFVSHLQLRETLEPSHEITLK